MDLFFLFIGSIILVLALMLFLKFKYSLKKTVTKDKNLRTQKDENGKIDFVRCPLCSTPLAKDEDMFS
ncbi:MAG: hypothetical protein IJ630_10575, partial [Treponema sp.]|nr:hypothetical protein [Treponema sp.]